MLAAAGDPAVASAITELGLDPIAGAEEPTPTFAAAHVYRLQELTTIRRIAEVKSRLQRTDPEADADDYNAVFAELVALEQHRRVLREHAVGAS